jgi:protein-L-isoaspartate(D-aspartate) O-methyltransferase
MESKVIEDPVFVGNRKTLIKEICNRGIKDLEILRLFDKIPRHLFIPEGSRARSYEDKPLPIGYGQTASQPSLQALYISILQPKIDETILEIGTGCGFMTALLSYRADRVYSIERIRDLSKKARRELDDLEINNVALMVGDGTIGWRKYAPFDVIIVSAAAPAVPPALVSQLGENGRMLIPVGDRVKQELVLVTKVNGKTSQETAHPNCSFVPLIGEFGWNCTSGYPEGGN